LQRILEPGQIESLASRSVPRLRLPERATLFAARAERLKVLAARSRIAGYLELMAGLAEAQHAALQSLSVTVPAAARLATARTHGMPVAQAAGGALDSQWRAVLLELVATVLARDGFPPAVAAVCRRLAARAIPELEADAAALLAADFARVDAAMAPFIMAALQVCWAALASRLAPADVGASASPGLCPVCGTLPVASVVRSGAPYAGFRYLHCGLCATEWHRVRVECTACGDTRGVAYHSIAGGSQAIRAESCENCHGYRKIFYQEYEPTVEPLADDLASVALDLLLTEAGFQRASGNPLMLAREA
jgi:FdhE protein